MTGVLSDAMMRLIDDWKFGFIATTGGDGAPNVSPKGTFLALDRATLAFAEIRSPRTRANLAHDPRCEVNIVDVFARSGARFRGRGRWIARGEAEFDSLYPRWHAVWGDALCDLFRGIVVIELESASALTSPAYDIGGEERTLRRIWLERLTEMQRHHLDG